MRDGGDYWRVTRVCSVVGVVDVGRVGYRPEWPSQKRSSSFLGDNFGRRDGTESGKGRMGNGEWGLVSKAGI